MQEKKYHCSHKDCFKSFKKKYDHTKNAHTDDEYSPVYYKCDGSPGCDKCKKDKSKCRKMSRQASKNVLTSVEKYLDNLNVYIESKEDLKLTQWRVYQQNYRMQKKNK